MDALTRQAVRGGMAFEQLAVEAELAGRRVGEALGGASAQMQRDDDIQAYGQELDALRARYNPLFAASKRYEMELEGINRAHSLGAINAYQQASAIDRLNASYTTATKAANAYAVGTGMATMRNQQLLFQLVALPLLLSGNIHGLQNVGFQLAQIGQLYYGRGGARAALSDSAAMLGGVARVAAPAALAIGAASLAIMDMQQEINRTSGMTVSFGNVALATFPVIRDGITAPYSRPSTASLAHSPSFGITSRTVCLRSLT